MSQELEIIPAETSDKVRFPRSWPSITLRLDGASYMNKKAVSMLGFKEGGMLRFYHTEDLTQWFIANDPNDGAEVKLNGGMYCFCELPNTRKLFTALGIVGRFAKFPLATELEKKSGVDVLMIIPKPQNIK